MTCFKDDILQKYLDKETSFDENLTMDEHLNHCTDCAKRMEQLLVRAMRIKKLIHSLGDENKEESIKPLPLVFAGKKAIIHTKNGWNPLKRLFFGVGAACLLALIFIYTPKAYPEKSQNVLLMQQDFVEIDANKPYSEQETTITVIDPDGNVSYSK